MKKEKIKDLLQDEDLLMKLGKREYNRQYAQKNREKLKAYNKEYRKKNKERIKKTKEKAFIKLAKKYIADGLITDETLQEKDMDLLRESMNK